MTIYEYVRRIEELERRLEKVTHDCDRYKRYINKEMPALRTTKRLNDLRSSMLAASLFMVIKNTSVAPLGKKLGKSPEEIDDMTYETMLEVSDMIDFKVANAALHGARHRYTSREIAKHHGME